MQLLVTIVLMGFLGVNSYFTNCVDIEGRLKSSDGKTTSAGHRILVYQENKLLCDSLTRHKGAFMLSFCLSSGEARNAVGDINTIDFFTIVGNKDTVLIGSVESFISDGELSGNLFLPKKGIANDKLCPKCRKSDNLYTLVYSPKEQKDFTFDAAKFYCIRDRTKF